MGFGLGPSLDDALEEGVDIDFLACCQSRVVSEGNANNSRRLLRHVVINVCQGNAGSRRELRVGNLGARVCLANCFREGPEDM
jgi:hypothetical protein